MVKPENESATSVTVLLVMSITIFLSVTHSVIKEKILISKKYTQRHNVVKF